MTHEHVSSEARTGSENNHDMTFEAYSAIHGIAVAEDIVPLQILERIHQDARHLSSGEPDPKLRQAVYDSQFRLEYGKAYSGRV